MSPPCQLGQRLRPEASLDPAPWSSGGVWLWTELEVEIDSFRKYFLFL